MRLLLMSTLAFACASAIALLSAAPRAANASTGVARCAMPDGTHAYSDTSCSSLGGHHAPLPADVLNRIQRERRAEAQLRGEAPFESGFVARQPRDAAPARRPLSQGCATTPRQLALDLHASMALGDANRIAESFDWAGMSHAQAMQMMARIERLGGLAVVDAEYFGASFGMAAMADEAGGTLQVILQDAHAQTVADFDVRRSTGCYFLGHTWSA
ncbi:hypothetical protein E2F46_03955 [Luteimonas aestuarii]|uniref:DUF4124 domain-containing protein n=1 Tax=Luteimonas aestuarii TaxID=453837 RepID=A0A4R5U1B0_9GAMM|nr:hypothetical protein [Luteimonas aestuarii]TDK27354.1 hypothetical protein E2F46_03955 [Luteimonas aestuarii]